MTVPNPTRWLVVNADDFGQTAGVNRGIMEGHEHGIVTSASLMVHWPAATAAAEYARSHPSLGVGLHIDLGEWAYRGGEWVALYEVVPRDDATAAAAEIARQLDAFRRLVGRDPTHLDSHQHVHRDPPVREIALAMAEQLGVPLRHFTRGVTYCGQFYGQTGKGESYPEAIRPEALIDLIRGLPVGLTELACHPARGSDVDSMYRTEREIELVALCDPRVRAEVEDAEIELVSFGRWKMPTPRRLPGC
ncbi:MAG: ChbG/HpnK family deacetylase [Gemmataceae bacterium]